MFNKRSLTMPCKVFAAYYDYARNSSGGALSTERTVERVEYRKDRMTASMEVFKALHKKAIALSKQFAPDGKTLLKPALEVRESGWTTTYLLLKGKAWGETYNGRVFCTYSIMISDISSLPDGETLTKGKFVFDPTFDNIPAPRDLASITDWRVRCVERFPYRVNFDLVKVELFSPSGSEKAFVNCEVKDGTFQMRELQDFKVHVDGALWNMIQTEYYKIA
jgi:hypothetical protein